MFLIFLKAIFFSFYFESKFAKRKHVKIERKKSAKNDRRLVNFKNKVLMYTKLTKAMIKGEKMFSRIRQHGVFSVQNNSWCTKFKRVRFLKKNRGRERDEIKRQKNYTKNSIELNKERKRRKQKWKQKD